MILGEKDYQQFMVVREMSTALNLAMEVIASPIIRDSDGLALSSRNGYLSTENLQKAKEINKILKQAILFHNVDNIVQYAKNELLQIVNDIDYLEIRNNQNLELCTGTNPQNCRLFFAGIIEKTRLIDNISF